MAESSDRVSGHAVMAEIRSLSTQLDESAQRASQDTDATLFFARMRATEAAAVALMNGADPLLVADSVMNGIASNIQSWRNHLSAYTNNGNASNLANAIGHVDSILTLLAQVPTVSRSRDSLSIFKAYSAAVQSYMEDVESRYAEAKRNASALAIRIEQLESQTSQVTAQVSNTANAQQQQFSQAQEQRLTEFGNAQQQRTAEFITATAQQRQAADEFLKTEDARVSAVAQENQERLEQLARDSEDAIAKIDHEYREAAGALISDLEDHKKSADDLVGIISERGVTSHYQKVADSARTAMFVWQTITIIGLGALIAAAVFEFLPALRNGWNWGVIAGRLFVTVAVALLAGYAGAEARENQKVMRENRQREMDLAAVGPYLASLPEETRQQFRIKLAERIFTPPVNVPSKDLDGAAGLIGDEPNKLLLGLMRLGVGEALKNIK